MPRNRTDVPQEYREHQRELARQIGSRIRERRLQLGFSQRKLREQMEINSVSMTKSQLSRVELGELLPDAVEVIALSEALGVTYRWLLEGEM